jgi:phosphoribosylformylglycinamidine synthase
MYSVMWSEHCSYKSSKVHLRRLPTEGPRVLQGPGENAGVVDVGGGVAAVFKIESHNHPSFVEPFQGAATGVGGIIRDVLAMGARPAASLNSLRFGDLADPLARRLLEGVVAGIGHYGNCVGVATVGGEVVFDPCYQGNPLVNALTVGFMPVGQLRLSGRDGRPGDLALLMGAKTGRDGIGGASVLASAGFEQGDEAKRPNVQVGDPFQEKLLIEACLELVQRGLLRGLQDLGAAGISCAVAEVAARAGLGMEVDLDAVPLREPSMEAWEVLVSESQERMLALVDPELLPEVLEVCARWGVLAGVLGRMADGGRLVVRFRGEVVADVPARSLADEGPTYERPLAGPRPPGGDPGVPLDADPAAAVLALAADPTCASKRWVWEQYDRFVGHGTVAGPGADAAVLRVPGGDGRAVALATDGNGRYAALDPAAGAALAVAEAARNVACTGATPAAVTNCLNFASPERPEVMGAFAAAVEGMAAACRALDLPVTGGNVSFYNESSGRPIHPTPIVGVLGLLEDATAAVGAGFPRAGLDVWLLGETRAELGGSAWQRLATGRLAGRAGPAAAAGRARPAAAAGQRPRLLRRRPGGGAGRGDPGGRGRRHRRAAGRPGAAGGAGQRVRLKGAGRRRPRGRRRAARPGRRGRRAGGARRRHRRRPAGGPRRARPAAVAPARRLRGRPAPRPRRAPLSHGGDRPAQRPGPAGQRRQPPCPSGRTWGAITSTVPL